MQQCLNQNSVFLLLTNNSTFCSMPGVNNVPLFKIRAIKSLSNRPTACIKVKLQTHTPSVLHVNMPNLLKINVYNFKYKIRVGKIMKVFFFFHTSVSIIKCISQSISKGLSTNIFSHAKRILSLKQKMDRIPTKIK